MPPTDYLLSFIRHEGKDVKHLTQGIIYFVGFPMIFLLKALTAFLVFALFVIHMLVSLIGFVAMLGGITFSPFLLDPVDRFAPRKNKKYRTGGLICFIAIGLSLLFLALCITPIANSIVETTDYNEFIDDMKATRKNDPALYEAFYEDYSDDRITKDNYKQSIYYLYNYRDYESDSSADIIAVVEAIISFAYIIFTAIYSTTFFHTKKELIEKPAADTTCIPEAIATPEE